LIFPCERACEIHHLDYVKCPPVEAIEREAKKKFEKVIPDGMAVSIFGWRERQNGEDFHARFVLTDKGGVGIDAGLSVPATKHRYSPAVRFSPSSIARHA
jgi:hypothetical protein